MDNKQQGAVEWLLEQFDRNKIVMYNELGERTKVFTLINNDIVAQAKEMEKEKTINFTEDWYFNGPLLGEGIDVKNTIEEHFNKTYGGDNK